MIRRATAFVSSILIAGSGADSAPLTYAAVDVANPLKGFMPFSGDHRAAGIPHSLEFFYLPLKDLMDGPETFTWQPLDTRLDEIAARGHQAVFRVYLDYPTKSPGTPDFLRNGPDGISGTNDDLVMRPYDDFGNNGGSLSPDYENPALRAALIRFINALGARYDGDARIGFLQIGLLGFWGEWHTHPHNGHHSRPDWFAPLPVQREILTAFGSAFTTTPLLAREPKAAFFKEHAIGYHDDSFAHSTLAPPDWHFSGKLARFGETDRWRTQPIGGEIRPEIQPGMWEKPTTVPQDQAFDRCVAALHPSWMLAHGAFAHNLSPAARQLAARQSLKLGYEFHVSTATITALGADQAVTIKITLRNSGVAPFYHDWPLELSVLDAAGKSVHTVRPRWSLTGLLPGEADRQWAHTTPAGTLPSGDFRLLLRAVTPLENGLPLRFANASQDADADGWLTLGSFTLQ